MNKFIKSRKMRYGSVALMLSALIIVAVIILNMILASLAGRYEWMYVDMNSKLIYSISEDCEEYLDTYVFSEVDKTNAALKDTCQRVGGDPARKLSANDRLIGSSVLAMEQGITPAYITVGAAAGMRRYLAENGKEQTLENALAVLQEVSQLTADAPLTKLILARYEEICNGADLDALCAKAEAVKTASLHQVV